MRTFKHIREETSYLFLFPEVIKISKMEKNNYQGALQQPINSGFNAKSTTNDVIKGIDLKNQLDELKSN